MNQTTTEKTPPLVSLADSRRVKNKIFHDLLVIERAD